MAHVSTIDENQGLMGWTAVSRAPLGKLFAYYLGIAIVHSNFGRPEHKMHHGIIVRVNDGLNPNKLFVLDKGNLDADEVVESYDDPLPCVPNGIVVPEVGHLYLTETGLVQIRGKLLQLLMAEVKASLSVAFTYADVIEGSGLKVDHSSSINVVALSDFAGNFTQKYPRPENV